jgi:DNA transformation protein and related proteins
MTANRAANRAVNREFADYCCELLQSAGPCTAKSMFGGWGISVDGMSIALIADLGAGDKLWLKADEDTRAQWLAAGCARFTYRSTKNGVTRDLGMNYYSAPEEAMDSPDAMRPWARLALDCAANALAVRLARRSAKGQPVKVKPKPPVKSKPKLKPASPTAIAKSPTG